MPGRVLCFGNDRDKQYCNDATVHSKVYSTIAVSYIFIEHNGIMTSIEDDTWMLV